MATDGPAAKVEQVLSPINPAAVMEKHEKKVSPPALKAVSGSLGGLVEASCLQPIDVIKTRLQLDRTKQYKGIIHCGQTIIKTEGVASLWKGLTPFATHLTLKYALRMGTNAMFQTALRDKKTGELSQGSRMLAGFGAGVTEALVIVTPFEVVKIRLQQQKGRKGDPVRYRGPIHCASTIVKTEGVLGLWAGAAPTVLRNGTNQAVMFSAKNAIDQLVWKKSEGDGRTLQPWQSMVSGFIAGTAGPVATGPFDVVKTRLMAQEKVPGVELRYRGLVHALQRIAAEEGVLALWKGLFPRLMRIPPGQAIVWGVADQITGFYERRHVASHQGSVLGPVATGPFDVVKTRLMAQEKVPGVELRYRGLVHALQRIAAEEGVLALWKGLFPRLMRIPPGQAIVWGVADQITGFYERRHVASHQGSVLG
eukprot:jgi/Mesen1/4151/ME000219S03281